MAIERLVVVMEAQTRLAHMLATMWLEHRRLLGASATYMPSLEQAIDAVLAVEYALENLAGRPKEKSRLKMKPPTAANDFFTRVDWCLSECAAQPTLVCPESARVRPCESARGNCQEAVIFRTILVHGFSPIVVQ